MTPNYWFIKTFPRCEKNFGSALNQVLNLDGEVEILDFNERFLAAAVCGYDNNMTRIMWNPQTNEFSDGLQEDSRSRNHSHVTIAIRVVELFRQSVEAYIRRPEGVTVDITPLLFTFTHYNRLTGVIEFAKEVW